jgi:hypothetical protein
LSKFPSIEHITVLRQRDFVILKLGKSKAGGVIQKELAGPKIRGFEKE